MANQLYDDYRERGLTIVHVIIEDGTGDGIIDWEDAHQWAYVRDFDGAGPYEPPLNVLVIADTDRYLWDNYKEACGSDIFCQLMCHVTPQHQMLDQGKVTVDDPCSGGQTGCSDGCGYSDSKVRTTLDGLLPVKWCGQADE